MSKVINAKPADKATAVSILSQSFAHDPQISWIIGEKGNKEKRLKQLMAYAFEYSLLNGKVQMTEDKNAVAIWKNPKADKMNWRLLVESMRFLYHFGIKRMIRISRMEKQLGASYPGASNYLYLWFIGTRPEQQGRGHGSSLLSPVLNEVERDGKEVYLETTTKSNVAYYEKKGFKLYGEKIIGHTDRLLVYLLRTCNAN